MPATLRKMFTILEAQDPYDLRSAYLFAVVVTATAVLAGGILFRGVRHLCYLLRTLCSPSTHTSELNRVDSVRARSAIRQILLETNCTGEGGDDDHDPAVDKKRE